MGIAFFFFLVLAFSRFFVVNLKFCLLPETDRNVWGLFLRLSTFVKTYFFSRCFVVLCRCPHWNLEEALVCVHAFCILAYFWRREYSFTGVSVLSCLTVALLQSSPSPCPLFSAVKILLGFYSAVRKGCVKLAVTGIHAQLFASSHDQTPLPLCVLFSAAKEATGNSTLYTAYFSTLWCTVVCLLFWGHA